MDVILACTHKGGIGINGTLPWRIKEDMKLFKKITTEVNVEHAGRKQNAVIMGRNTWESIPDRFRPLPNRINIILSTTMNKEDTEKKYETGTTRVYVVSSLSKLEELLHDLDEHEQLATPFIIGGAKLYNMVFELDKVYNVHLSLIKGDYECDTFIDMSYIHNDKFGVSKVETFKQFDYFNYQNNKL